MTKFVAAIFLPVVLALTSLIVDRGRSAWRDRRIWLSASALALLLIVPWFVFAAVRFGDVFWRDMFGDSILVRFTKYLDPNHVHPWYFYFVTMYDAFTRSQTSWVVAAGFVFMLVRTIRRPSADGVAVLVWAVVPLCAISVGTSKLYHYAYPFLPPLAIAGGVFASWVFDLLRTGVEWALGKLDGVLTPLLAPLRPLVDPRPVRAALLAVTMLGLALTVVTFVYGPFRINLGSLALRNASLARPLAVAVVCGILGGSYRKSAPLLAMALLFMLGPRAAYAEQLSLLKSDLHPMRDARDCLVRIQAEAPPGPAGIFIDAPPSSIGHPLYYYFLSVRPWVRREWAPPQGLAAYMYDPAELRPALAQEKTYEAFIRQRDADGGPHAGQSWPTAVKMYMNDVVLMLPKEYAACAPALTPLLPASVDPAPGKEEGRRQPLTERE
jgi:hypothetical protein